MEKKKAENFSTVSVFVTGDTVPWSSKVFDFYAFRNRTMFAALVLQLAFRSHHQLAYPEFSDSRFLFHTWGTTTSRIVFEADFKFLIKFSVLLRSVGLFYESSFSANLKLRGFVVI